MAPVPARAHAELQAQPSGAWGRNTRAGIHLEITEERSGDFAARHAQASTNGARPLAPSNLTTGAAVSFSPYVRKKRSRVF